VSTPEPAADLPPLTLYVHFPWCVRKCPYCDFNSHALHDALPEHAYISALLADLASQAALVPARPVRSIFLGGGTPSLFSPEALARLLAGIGRQLAVAADAEITLEANPGTIERGRFADYRSAGINRVSLGVQSFEPAQLQALGRIHDAADAYRAVGELDAAGIANFNLDLMYALPRQTAAQALADVNAALALSPAHISHYQLTLEPGTVFGGRPPAGMPDPDAAADMQLRCQDALAQAGYAQYEVSAYARPGRRCRHNLNYWRFGDYLGIGAGAHGKLCRRRGAGLLVERSAREREPRRYLAALAAPGGAPIGATASAPRLREVPAAELPFEYMMNALRLVEGFEESEFEQRTGLGCEVLQGPLGRATRRGLIAHQAGRWRATALGFNFLNDLLGEFIGPARHTGAIAASGAGFMHSAEFTRPEIS
jgi:oxygen-independent coproporphyrinogen-3 oxidase